MRLGLLYASLALALAGAAHAPAFAEASAGMQVYPGCASPPAAPGAAAPPTGAHHFLDPVLGAMSGDGSAAHPWPGLAAVVAAGMISTAPPKARAKVTPIHPGDTLELMSGDHGAVKIQGWLGDHPMTLSGYDNPDWITVEAAPGQAPVLQRLTIDGGSKFIFRRLTIESENPGLPVTTLYPYDYFLVDLHGPHSNIVLDELAVRSADAPYATIAEWHDRRASGIRDLGGYCVAITGNTVRNVGFGMATQGSSGVLILGNLIDHFADDGVDYGSSNLAITGNRITTSVEDGDGFHRDGMQGQPNLETTLNSHIAITGNTIVRLGDPNLAFPGYLQGIAAFDGLWADLTIAGNHVSTSAGQAISIYGVDGVAITGNIVTLDAGLVLPCANLQLAACQALSVVTDLSNTPRIVVNHSKAQVASNNAVIDGNQAPSVTIDLATTKLTVSNNVCYLSLGRCIFGIPVAGKMVWAARKPTVIPDHNVIAAAPP